MHIVSDQRREPLPRQQHATDVIMVDPYPIGIDTTPCSASFGCCGCDDCEGTVRDVATRLDTVAASLPSTKQLWLVLQAFGGQGHWSHPPTPAQLRCMTYLGLQHGARLAGARRRLASRRGCILNRGPVILTDSISQLTSITLLVRT
jgi:hypothetical protein